MLESLAAYLASGTLQLSASEVVQLLRAFASMRYVPTPLLSLPVLRMLLGSGGGQPADQGCRGLLALLAALQQQGLVAPRQAMHDLQEVRYGLVWGAWCFARL